VGDLDQHFERLKWLEGEIERLAAEVQKYTDSEPIEVFSRMCFTRGYITRIYRTRIREQVPTSIKAHAGTIINEMRAILDALACSLAQRNGHKNVSGTYFPTGKTKAIFESNDVQKKIKKLGDQDKHTIAALEPYGGGNEMLYALHSSDIIRKHQRLILVAGEVCSTVLGNDGSWVLDGGKLIYANLGPGVPLDKPIAETAWDYELPIRQNAEIAFSEPPAIKSKPLIATLKEFFGLVYSILELFNG